MVDVVLYLSKNTHLWTVFDPFLPSSRLPIRCVSSLSSILSFSFSPFLHSSSFLRPMVLGMVCTHQQQQKMITRPVLSQIHNKQNTNNKQNAKH